jgi:hypothetical protein
MTIAGRSPAPGDDLRRVIDSVRQAFQNGASQSELDSVSGDLTTLQATVADVAVFAFSAHNNGTDQTGIARGVHTNVTFGSELFDTGNTTAPPTPSARRRPGWSGSARIYTGRTQPTPIRRLQEWRAVPEWDCHQRGRPTWRGNVAVIGVANGSDYYEVYAFSVSGGTLTTKGNSAITYFMGWTL